MFPRYVLRPSADHTPWSQVWGVPYSGLHAWPPPERSLPWSSLLPSPCHLGWVRKPLFSQHAFTVSWAHPYLKSVTSTEEASSLYVWLSPLWKLRLEPSWSPGPTPSQLLHRNVWLQTACTCSLGCLQCSFYLKYRRIYTSKEFLHAMTRLCRNLHLPAKTRKHLQRTKFFFSVSELKLLVNRRRESFPQLFTIEGLFVSLILCM